MSLFLRQVIRQVHSSNFVVKKATINDRKELLRLMTEVFFKTDPSSVYTKVAELPLVSSPIQEMSVETLPENLTYVATINSSDTKICGAAINGIRQVEVTPNYMEDLINSVTVAPEKTLLQFWKYISSLPPDLKKRVENEKNIFELRFLVVDPAYRNKGIATALMSSSIKEAAAQGLKYIRVDCTSHFTARITNRLGLKSIYEFDYTSYKNPKGEIVFTNPQPPHTRVVICAGRTS